MDDASAHFFCEVGFVVLSNYSHCTVVCDLDHDFRISVALLQVSDKHGHVERDSLELLFFSKSLALGDRSDVLGDDLVVLFERTWPVLCLLAVDSVVKHQHNRHVRTETQLEVLTGLLVLAIRALVNHCSVELIQHVVPHVDSLALRTPQSSQYDLLLDLLEPAELGEARFESVEQGFQVEMTCL